MNCHLPPRNSSRPDTFWSAARWLCVTPDSTPSQLSFFINAITTTNPRSAFHSAFSGCSWRNVIRLPYERNTPSRRSHHNLRNQQTRLGRTLLVPYFSFNKRNRRRRKFSPLIFSLSRNPQSHFFHTKNFPNIRVDATKKPHGDHAAFFIRMRENLFREGFHARVQTRHRARRRVGVQHVLLCTPHDFRLRVEQGLFRLSGIARCDRELDLLDEGAHAADAVAVDERLRARAQDAFL